MTCLRVYTQHVYPQQPTRFQDLLGRLPEVNWHCIKSYHFLLSIVSGTIGSCSSTGEQNVLRSFSSEFGNSEIVLTVLKSFRFYHPCGAKRSRNYL